MTSPKRNGRKPFRGRNTTPWATNKGEQAARTPPSAQQASDLRGGEQRNSDHGPTSPQEGEPKVPPRAPSEVRAELKRLQDEIIQKAYLNLDRITDHAQVASPELLADWRVGPGTNPESARYKFLMQRRSAGQIEADLRPPAAPPAWRHGITRDDPVFQAQFASQFPPYRDSESVYPKLVDGKVVLTSEPSKEQKAMKERHMRRDKVDPVSFNDPPYDNPYSMYANWDYAPPVDADKLQWRRSFDAWLQRALDSARLVDINRKPFFSGKALPDGTHEMYKPNWSYEWTWPDPNDEEGRKYQHETSQGYVDNRLVRIKEDLEVERRLANERLRADIQFYKRYPKPGETRKDLYLRPVDDKDVEQLARIFTHFSERSPMSLDVGAISEEIVRTRIASVKEHRLPFIVAAKYPVPGEDSDASEKVLGFALAVDHDGPFTTGQFTVKLEFYILPREQQHGVGTCLLDKMLSVLDDRYTPKRGYHFRFSPEDGAAYRPGGLRNMARVIVTCSFPWHERDHYQYIRTWLQRKWGFTEQGHLHGTRIKFDHL
ncbi:GNAT family N-acetyltransferase [Aspergillus saccharolyticus JOP 1030-1]|uniref:N-acetyltransferase domain-containing protein n=1 Tax=Aspergillus saccharolyticus JOP 1030-1 TaxID=1450539 RepID=A0A318ZPF8_9EURO|nr:hypothetical protein BP01DRAFT_398279 [Aspergillus saccharolyticus JOP 1030-1]PYH45800.1 hypothetical protein BP01DRAFT_398279 [Aspergillus saccharolyticus JOP 1030-1]